MFKCVGTELNFFLSLCGSIFDDLDKCSGLSCSKLTSINYRRNVLVFIFRIFRRASTVTRYFWGAQFKI